ncbi:MAG: acetolactate synthase [Pseudonocardia sp. SCN 73-27]|nr:MAG: acetolactate synthase [Pseudonocardia sp. SCN 73-27]
MVADEIARELVELGVRTVFGLLGSGNFLVTEALRQRGVRIVGGRHEGPALAMADGYARSTGTVGVCTVSTGPGLTNTVTALGEAAKSRTPLLVLAGDVPGRAVRNNFRVDQHGIAEAVGAVAERIHSPGTAVADTRRAYRRALLERRPVVLNLPTDVQESDVAPVAPLPALPPAISAPAPDEQAVASTMAMLAAAERPLILCGRGAALSGAGPAVEALADRVGALLATTACAHGLYADHRYDLGISGGFSTPLAAELIPQADVVLVLGASLTYWTTRHGTLIGERSRVIQVDLEPSVIGAGAPVELGILADVRATAEAIAETLEAGNVQREGWRTPEIAARIAERGRWAQEPFTDAGDDDHIDPRTLTIEVDRHLPAQRAVAIDSGHFLGFPSTYLEVPDAAAFVFPNAFQSVGLGLGAGIGAAVADPSRPTVVAVGDGGALMALGELETIAQLGLPILVLVYNDSSAGAETHHFGPLGYPLDIVTFPDVDFAAVARGLGIPAMTVRSPDDLDELEKWSSALDGPFLVDAKVHPDVRAHWIEEAFRGDAH